MGNNHSNRSSSKFSRSFKSKSSKSSKSLSRHERFFIAHHKAQQSVSQFAESPDTQIDLQQRVIFVSIMGLFQSWRNCPSTVLYSSIFILPLKKQWIYHEKYHHQHDFARILHDTDFVKLLQWKDAQGLVFWMKDDIPLSEYKKCRMPTQPDFVENDGDESVHKSSVHIAPFWSYLSFKLSSLYDPVTGKKYKPLLLDDVWWRQQYKVQESRFNATYTEIHKELLILTMKFKTISEILYQSNNTLNIVTSYASPNERSYHEDISQKSYNSLPDHKLIGRGEVDTDCNHHDDNVNDTNHGQQIMNTFITPYNSENQKNDENDEESKDSKDCKECKGEAEAKNNDESNIWWVSEEYDEVIDTQHDNDDDEEDVNHDESISNQYQSQIAVIAQSVTI